MGNSEKRLSAVAIVRNQRDKVLIIKRPKNMSTYKDKWVLPGGNLDPGETPEQCVLRELEEEVSLVGKSPRLATIKESKPSAENKYRHYMMYFFHVKVPFEQNPKPNPDEVSTHTWVGANDYQDYDIAAKTREFLDELFGQS